MSQMQDGDVPLLVRLQEFPGGVRCASCKRELKDGETYSRRLSAFVEETPIVQVVCVSCGLGITRGDDLEVDL